MATKKKLLQAAAGQAGGEALNVEDVFSTYLYEGTGSALTINNGIDLAGEGGLVWQKLRNQAKNHNLFDTVSGVNKYLSSNQPTEQLTDANINFAFNANGFSMNNSYSTLNALNDEGVSWTFRKAPKFFDIVTYTGDGVAGRTISHNLGTTVGSIFVKRTDAGWPWQVYHRGLSNPATKMLQLHNTEAEITGFWYGAAATSTEFTVNSSNSVNQSGGTYVAYLFAHNDGDGEFGADGDLDIIKCGSYTASNSGVSINLGFEPQWVMIKRTDSSQSWYIFDTMRGFTASDNPVTLKPDSSDAEGGLAKYRITSTGFQWNSDSGDSGREYIYMAIRRGTKVPESGTEVFAIDNLQNPTTVPAFQSGFPVDLALVRNVNATYDMYVKDRLRGTPNLQTNTTAAELSFFSTADFDYMSGWYNSGTNTDFYSWMWKRAPGYFDVVAYTGNSTAGRTVSHNLTVAPEMMWVKRRNTTDSWAVFLPSILGNTKALVLDQTLASFTYDGFNDTDPSDTAFTLGSDGSVNASGSTYIAYLFASLPGISKVGSYTGNGGTQNIDCGFSSGARFVLIKCSSDGLSDWHVMDSTRGIVAGNDPFLYLNDTTAEDSGEDMIDPYSSGFALAANNRVNTSGRTYIFYAIA